MHFCTFKFPTSIQKFARITNYKCLNTSLSTSSFFLILPVYSFEYCQNRLASAARRADKRNANVLHLGVDWSRYYWLARVCVRGCVPQEGNAPFHRYCSRLTATDGRIKLKLYLINSSRARYAVTCWGARRWGRNLSSRPPAWSTIPSDYCLQDFLDCRIVICQFRGVECTIER